MIQPAPDSDIQPTDVLFMSMPFGLLDQPSIGLSLLQAQLASAGRSSRIRYFTFLFASTIGLPLYSHLADGAPLVVDQTGEWLFSAAVDPGERPRDRDDEAYLANVLHGRDPAHRPTNPTQEKHISQAFLDGLLRARAEVPAFLDRCLREVLAYQPKIVGFTSVIQQQLASLALAQRIKRARPDIAILFGGTNCEGAMGAELVRQFPFVDAVVSGEADCIIVELVARMLSGNAIADLQGVYAGGRSGSLAVDGSHANAPLVTDMDSLPYPDYTDYFAQKAQSGLDVRARVLCETSRGCWWGEKTHCSFCGLSDSKLRYRSKSPARAVEELIALHEQYPECAVDLVDDILDMRYFRTLLPRLAALKHDMHLFYEVKANLSKQQVRLLGPAGVAFIQPGIESLSTPILARMRKGVTALQNIQLLKWCAELGVQPLWNVLWGFPGEEPQEYASMELMMPLLSHLPPPHAAQHVLIDRFSPLFSEAEQFGLTDLQPYPSYGYIYPSLSPHSLRNMAYHFTAGDPAQERVREYVRGCAVRIEEWRRSYPTSLLHAVVLDGVVYLWDRRPIATQHVTRLTGLERALYLACDAAQPLSAVRAIVAEHLGPMSDEESRALLRPFLDRQVMLAEDNHYLSLAVLLTDRAAPRYKTFLKLLYALDMSGRTPDDLSSRIRPETIGNIRARPPCQHS